MSAGTSAKAQVRRSVRNASKDIQRLIDAADRITAKRAVVFARQLSNGRFSLAQLRTMGHPYAVRHGSAALDLAIINKQKGDFYRGWKARLTGQISIVNTDPIASYLVGMERPDSKMKRRPIDTVLEQWIAVERPKEIKRQIAKRT